MKEDAEKKKKEGYDSDGSYDENETIENKKRRIYAIRGKRSNDSNNVSTKKAKKAERDRKRKLDEKQKRILAEN